MGTLCLDSVQTLPNVGSVQPLGTLFYLFSFCWSCFWYYTAQSFQLGIYVSFMPVCVGLMHNSKNTSCRRCGESCHLQCVCITYMIQFNLLISQLLNFFHGFTAHITQYTFNIQYLATKSRHVIWCSKEIPLTVHLMLIQKRNQGFGFSLWKLGLLW